MSNPSPTFVWDLHTRLFHWLLVLLISASFATGLYGDMDWMDWHIKCGYGLLGLMFFRLYTGFVGGDYGHFSRFPLSPASAFRYVRGQQSFAGHNPLGSWMVIFMLCAVTLQVLSGLLTTDDYFFEGPWVYWMDDDWVSLGGKTHHLVWQFLAGFIGLHLAAVLFYQFVKKDKLVNAMVTGHKDPGKQLPNENGSVTKAARRMPFWGICLLAVFAAGSAWALILLPSWLS